MTEHVSVKAIRRATRRGPRAIRDVPGDAVAQGWASTAVCFRRAVRGVNPRGAQTDRDAPGADTHERVMRGPGVVWPGSEPQLRLMHRRGTWCALRVVSVRILTGPARDWAMRVGEPAAAAHAPTPCLVRRCSWRPICVSYHPQQPPTDRPTRWWVPRLHGMLAPPPLHRPGRPRPFPTGLRAMLRCCDLPKIRPLHPKIRPLHVRYVRYMHMGEYRTRPGQGPTCRRGGRGGGSGAAHMQRAHTTPPGACYMATIQPWVCSLAPHNHPVHI